MKKYIIGDLHGELEKLEKCLESVNFDFENDTLIQLGDVVDRGVDVYGCVELLLKIKNLIPIRGNHDSEWMRGLMDYNEDQQNQNMCFGLFNHGARETLQSYTRNGKHPLVHLDFFTNQLDYYIDEDRNFFVHAGFNRHYLLSDHKDNLLYLWDRDLFLSALAFQKMKNNKHKFKIKENFKEIFLGHTPTMSWGIKSPMKATNITNCDTGSGKGGLLTILDFDTREFKQF